jgi:Predicted amidohydrolase
MSFHPGLSGCEEVLEKLALDRTIVGLMGVDSVRHNSTLLATSGTLIRQEKISLSSDDEDLQVKRGRELNMFGPTAEHNQDAVSWAVLNCHDYTHVDILRVIQARRIEVLVVVTYNSATRLYWQYAVSDVHRLFCYVVIANVAELGGSGVFAPFRRIGQERNAQIGSGGQVFGARGAGEFQVNISLNIGELRSMRREFAEYGFKAPAIVSTRGSIYTPMVPSEHYMDTFDRKSGPPPLGSVTDVPNDWNLTKPRVAIAQLNDIGLEAYIQTRYRIRQHESCSEFEYMLSVKLLELEARCRQVGVTESKTLLDLLVFPEVFIPRSFAPTLQGFSNRMGAIIVAGLDYPDGGEDMNANECIVIRPYQKPVEYRKITRSQYDAHRNNDGDRMPMRRGQNLVRFVNTEGRGFGVLICYDLSHFDLLWNLNLFKRETPLDLIVVVAHNPFGDLYRSCCIADAHRFYQYVVMCNVSRYGGSGVFGPIRTPGARQVLLEAGKGVETLAVTELDLGKLNAARRTEDKGLHRGDFMRRPGVFKTRWLRDDKSVAETAAR